MSELPKGWLEVELSEIAEVIRGVTYKKEQAIDAPKEGFLPVLRATNITGSALTFGALVYVPAGSVSETQQLRTGDVVIASSSGSKEIVGKAGNFASRNFVGSFGAFCTGLRPSASLSAGYFGFFFQTPSYRKSVSELSSGSNINNLKTSDLASQRFSLPPHAEQTRIVAKLEELLSDLDAGVVELKAAQKKLAQYRQSLLKAAVTGELTSKWRAALALSESDKAENGQQLLQRILTERRAGWEAKQFAKFKAQGKTPPKDWQKKYPEPVKPDTSGLPELPEGWVYASLDQLLLQLRSGSAETSSRETTEFPVLKSSAVRPASIDYSALNYLTLAQSRIENQLESGDLLISRLSGSVEYVGCCAQVVAPLTHGVQYPDRLFCGKLVAHAETLGAYIVICVSSPHARAKIEKAAKSTAGHKRISLSDLHPFAIALPPLQEAQELIRLMEIALSEIARQESAVRLSLKQSTAQRQNILRAAFAGQLVPQDPDDEPASVLLARLRAERVQRETEKKPRGRKPKEAA